MLRTEQRRLLVTRWALRIAAFAVALIATAALLHRFLDLPTPVALNLILLAFAGALTAIVLAGYGLVRIWQRGFHGTGNALVAIAIAVAILMWPVSLLPEISRLPQINDITTDTDDPPVFRALAQNRPAGAQDVAYDPAFAEKQRAAYPDLRPLMVDRDPTEVFTLAGQTLRRLRMNVVRDEPPAVANNGVGWLEATDRTLVMGFTDDVVVRVTDAGRGARIDVRSASRFGRHDLGRNAERVRRILTGLIQRIQATVPQTGRR